MITDDVRTVAISSFSVIDSSWPPAAHSTAVVNRTRRHHRPRRRHHQGDFILKWEFINCISTVSNMLATNRLQLIFCSMHSVLGWIKWLEWIEL